jgi:peptide/nickel transport system permease protein
MIRYSLRRLLQAIPLLAIVSVFLFVLTRALGDPLATFGGRQVVRSADRERLTRQLGLDQPVCNCLDQRLRLSWQACWHHPLRTQYMSWLIGNTWTVVGTAADGTPQYGIRRGLLRGDLGTSFVTRRPVLAMIGERLPNTLLLMGSSEVVIVLLALFCGMSAALKPYSRYDHLTTTLTLIGYSLPIQLVAFALIYLFAVRFKHWGLPYFPTGGVYDPLVGSTLPQVLWHLVLPVTATATTYVAAYSRYIRASMLEVMAQDYIRTARAKGLDEYRIVLRHALKNAALPLVTLLGLDLPFLLAGAVVVETIFAWPGIGRLFIEHTSKADVPVLMGILSLLAVAIVVTQLLTDLAYAVLDPRIRYERQ